MMSDGISRPSPGEIMVVEDNAANLRYLRDILTQAGYLVRPAGDGRLALRSIQAKVPDLVLLDVRLPDIDGIEVCRRLKADSKTNEVPIIFISALGETELKVKALEAGGVDYVTKPFASSEVLTRINTHLHMHRLQQRLMAQSEELVAEIKVRRQAERELEKHREHLEVLLAERSAALQESEEKYRHLFESSIDGIAAFSLEGKLISCNSAYARMTGYTEEELQQLPFDRTTPDKWASLDQQQVHRCLERGFSDVYEKEQVKKDGSLIQVCIRIWLRRGLKGRADTLWGIIRDITENKQVQRRLQQVQKMESIGTLAGGIAHDFNNLLFPIVGMSEMLLEDLPAGSPERQNVQEIFEAAQRGADLVRQILTYSRQSESQKIPCRIQWVLKDVLRLARSAIPVNVPIDADIQDDCALVSADPGQLHQVAMNLITNAFHAVEAADGGISVSLKEMEILGDEEDGSLPGPGTYVVLTVADSGIGMVPSVLDKIFDPYFTTKAKEKGTGLGLAVVQGIVEDHNGHLQVHSEEGKGSVFSVYFPVFASREKAVVVNDSTRPATGTERILLVDDETVIARLEKQMLERLGYRVVSHMESLRALADFKENPNRFDVVLTDMTMPGMTGDQLAKEILAVRPDLPVIICTGYNEQMDPEKAAALGIKGFLMKPVVKADMARMIRKVLDGAEIGRNKAF